MKKKSPGSELAKKYRWDKKTQEEKNESMKVVRSFRKVEKRAKKPIL